MPTNVLMPALSPTMEKGTLSKWLIKEGDTVNAGDVIAEIETDKATMEVEAADEGKVGKIVVPEGTEDVAVNSVIAVLLGDGESASDIGAPGAGCGHAEGRGQDARKRQSRSRRTRRPRPDQPPTHKLKRPSRLPSAEAAAFSRARWRAVWPSRRGFGFPACKAPDPHGRIIKHDVEVAQEKGVPSKPAAKAARAPAAAAAQAMPRRMPYEEIKLSSMRKTIAKRLEESKRTIPHFYLTVDVEIDKLLALRKQIKSTSDEYNVSVNDFIIKACAMALKKMPSANVQYAGDKLLQFKRVGYLGGGGDRRRADHAGHSRRGIEEPERHLDRDARARRQGS